MNGELTRAYDGLVGVNNAIIHITCAKVKFKPSTEQKSKHKPKLLCVYVCLARCWFFFAVVVAFVVPATDAVAIGEVARSANIRMLFAVCRPPWLAHTIDFVLAFPLFFFVLSVFRRANRSHFIFLISELFFFKPVSIDGPKMAHSPYDGTLLFAPLTPIVDSVMQEQRKKMERKYVTFAMVHFYVTENRINIVKICLGAEAKSKGITHTHANTSVDSNPWPINECSKQRFSSFVSRMELIHRRK